MNVWTIILIILAVLIGLAIFKKLLLVAAVLFGIGAVLFYIVKFINNP
jgi:hypothetical protein